MSYLLVQQNMLAGQKGFLPPTFPAPGGASFIVLEVDGTSHIELEGSTDDLLLEA